MLLISIGLVCGISSSSKGGGLGFVYTEPLNPNLDLLFTMLR